ncbi:hypothetical protein EJB05_29398, partial [Eragrostis curvula]
MPQPPPPPGRRRDRFLMDERNNGRRLPTSPRNTRSRHQLISAKNSRRDRELGGHGERELQLRDLPRGQQQDRAARLRPRIQHRCFQDLDFFFVLWESCENF